MSAASLLEIREKSYIKMINSNRYAGLNVFSCRLICKARAHVNIT